MSQLRVNSITNAAGVSSPAISGSIVQVQEYRSVAGDKTASSGAYVNIMSVTFTTKFANSKLFLTYYSGQMNPGSAQSNPMFEFQIDGVAIPNMSTNHIFYSDSGSFTTRPTVTIPIMTGQLTQGSHTVLVRGGAYNSTYTFDFQSSGSNERSSRLIVMEVAA